MDPDPALSVLVVTYNSRSFIDDCIAAVRATAVKHRTEIIVADNASTDGSAAHVRARWPEVTVIDMGANTGFATANNAAWERSSGRHIVLLNGDAVVADGALDAMVDFLDEHPHAGVVAPRLLNPDGSDQQTARAFPTAAAGLWGRRSPLTRAFPNNRWSRRYLVGRDHRGEGPFQVDWVSGACLMVPRRVVTRVGPLDPGFFMHWEDADWCRRIKDTGAQVWVEPAATVVHAEGSSRRGWPAVQVRHFHYGAYRYYRKHHLGGVKAAARPLVAGALTLRATVLMARAAAARRPHHFPLTTTATAGTPAVLDGGEP